MRMALPLTLRVGDGRIEQVPRKTMEASRGLTGAVVGSGPFIIRIKHLGRRMREFARHPGRRPDDFDLNASFLF